MSDREYELTQKLHIERLCKNHFDVELYVDSIIASDIEMVQDDSYATLFMANGTMYTLCETSKPVTLQDIKSQIKSMGMEADFYYPPAKDMNYFSRYGKVAFSSIFPGRPVATEEETLFYQTLAPYSPALVQIREVKGEIRRFNMRGNTWQAMKNFSYSRIQVQ